MADSLYDTSNLTDQQVQELASKARSRNAGEGMTDYQTALDQIRFEENNLLNTDTNYADTKLYRDLGEVYTNFTRQDGALKGASQQQLIDYFNKVGGVDKFGQERYDRVLQDIQNGSLDIGQNFSNLYNTLGPIAAAKAIESYFTGNQQADDYSQVVSTYNQGAISGQGAAQGQATAQGESLAATGNITHTGQTFFDSKKGVDVTAPAGTFAVQYENGAVEFRKLPTSGRIPTPQEITASGREAADVGSVGKDVARTGANLFNPTTGADVSAPEGKYVVEYTDGTYEFRDLPPGGFVPLPTQLKSGGDSSGAQDINTAGKTIDELRAEQGLRPLTEINKPEGELGGNGLAKSSDLVNLGTSYKGPNGETRTAGEGNAFFQDPKTGTILERQISQQQYAGEKGGAQEVAGLFQQAFGRTPNSQELAYWQSRTDKSGAALLGAMQYAKQNGQSVGEGASSPTSPESLLGKYDIQPDAESAQSSPIETLQDWYQQVLEKQGVPEMKQQWEEVQKQQEELDNEFADQVEKINLNPWLSEADRSRRVARAQDKYETKKAQLTARQQMYQSFIDSARQEAQYITSTSLQQYNADRTFDLQQQQFAFQQAESRIDTAIKLETLQLQKDQANLRELQGGLFDIAEGQWIVPPKAETLDPNTYANIISDIYQNYDPAEAAQILQNVNSQIKGGGQTLSLQSIVPLAQNIGTKFGESTFAQAHHSGVDIPAPNGSPVLAPMDLTIKSVGSAGSYGNSILAVGADGTEYRFAHLSGFNVKAGDTVKAGAPLGKVGSTGLSTGPHLHMEVMQNGQFIDPVQYFGLTPDTQPIKSKKQKADEAAAAQKRKEEGQALSNELVKGDLYKQIVTGGTSLLALDAFERQFKEHGTTSILSPYDRAKLTPLYKAAVLDLKEFFKLGVLNGQDQVIIEQVLPDPTNVLNPFGTRKASVNAGLTNLKSKISKGLDDAYLALVTQYSGYTADEVRALKDVQFRYLTQKSIIDPSLGTKLDKIRKENPGITNDELIQLIL